MGDGGSGAMIGGDKLRIPILVLLYPILHCSKCAVKGKGFTEKCTCSFMCIGVPALLNRPGTVESLL